MGSTGLGTDPFNTGGEFTAANANALNNGINDNDSRITTLETSVSGFTSELTVTVHGSVSSNTAFAARKRHTLTVSGSFTASITWGSEDYQWCELVITGDASNTITWPTANWSFNTEPTQPFAAKYQIIRFTTYNAGSTVFGFEVGSDME